MIIAGTGLKALGREEEKQARQRTQQVKKKSMSKDGLNPKPDVLCYI